MPDVTPQGELDNPYAGDGESDFPDPADSATPQLEVPDGETDFDMGREEAIAGYSPEAVAAGDGLPSADLPPITTPVERNAVATVPTKGEDFVAQYDESTIVPSQTTGQANTADPVVADTTVDSDPKPVTTPDATPETTTTIEGDTADVETIPADDTINESDPYTS